jgi:hypothetical protein
MFMMRHQAILHGMKRVLRDHGVLMSTSVIPEILRQTGKDVGPDGLVLLPSDSIAFDITVSHQSQLAHNYIHNHRDLQKSKKYDDLAKHMNWTIAPLVFTTQGHPIKSATTWMAKICSNSSVRGALKRVKAAAIIANVRGSADITHLLSRYSSVPSSVSEKLTSPYNKNM